MTALFRQAGGACEEQIHSMLGLPSTPPGSKGVLTPVRRHIDDLWLGASGRPGFHPKVIQAYATFDLLRSASFRLPCRS
jgi:hypothetical protein